MRYWAVEGNSGCGKTTTARGLARAWAQPGFVGEYIDYFAPLGLTVPELPPPGEAVGRAQSVVWTAIDERRFADLASVHRGPRPAVMDTSMLSVLACETAKREFGGTSAEATIATRYLALLDAGAVWPPDVWILLETTHEELERRIGVRGGSRPFLRRPEVAAHLQAFRASFARRYLGSEESVRISNDAVPLAEVVAAVTARVDDRGSGAPGAGLRRFLQDVAHGHVTMP